MRTISLILTVVALSATLALAQSDSAAKKVTKGAPPPAAREAAEPSAGAASGVEVPEVVVCTGVANRKPEGEGTEFAADVGRLYCFTHIKGVSGTADIQHKWYLNDALVSTVTLTVKAASWRTYSYKTIGAGMSGSWRVDVVEGATDAVLESVAFTVK
jgi:hypothetical protein